MEYQSVATPYTVTDFLEWKASDQLNFTPAFRRRSVWVPKAKSYLIDTILRYLPIPPFYVRLTINPEKKRTMREVVDGQQRLRTVFEYIHNDFPLMAVHNEDFPNMFYSDLPDDAKKKLLAYKFNVHVLENLSDPDVLSIFARINTYTVKLNDQELRNAQFFGAFKQTVYKLAYQHNAFWKVHRILTDMQIARMGDAELVSELVVSMLDGIRQTKKRDLKEFYQKYEDSFPHRDSIAKEFRTVMDRLGEIFAILPTPTKFRRIPLFYSLFLLIYDARFGLPKTDHPRMSLGTERIKRIADGLARLDKSLKMDVPAAKYEPFIEAIERSTADVGKRQLRHEFLWQNILEKAYP